MAKLNNKKFKEILKEICNEENIKMTYLSKGWIIMLEKNNQCKFIAGYKFDLNPHALGEICDDKYALYELLKTHNLPIVDHHLAYLPNNQESYAQGCNNIEYLKELFHQNEESVVLKINNGTCGEGVYHITDERNLEKSYKDLEKYNCSLSLCPFMKVENEYRVIMFHNNPELIYKKELPIVYGDGKSTIKELLIKFNYEYFKNYNENNKDLILKKNEEYIYNWKFNLSGGAKISLDIQKNLKNEILNLAKTVSKTIGLEFGSIDIIKTLDNKLYVLEINSGVMMDNLIKELNNGYDIAKKIYTKAIKMLFN